MIKTVKSLIRHVERKGLERIRELVRQDAVGEVGPDLPAQRRAFLLCWHDVSVRYVDSARFGLQQKKNYIRNT